MELQDTPIPQTSPVPPKPPTPQVKNSLVLIMSILLIITVAIAGLFYFQIQKLSKELSKYQVQPSPTLTATATPDPTINWKTYTNDKYLYSLKYPDTIFKYNNGTANDFSVSTYYDILDEKNVSLSVGTVSGPDFDSLDKYIDSNPLLNENSTKKQISIDGISGYKINHIGWGGAELTYKSYVIGGFVFKNGVIYGIHLASKSEDLINKYSPVFDQILSTFKFLGQSNAEGKFCGGIAANLPENQCPEGFSCKLDGKYPDAGGVCTKN